MAKGLTLLWLLVLPLLTIAQSSSPSSNPPSSVITFTTLSTFVTLGPSRTVTTGTSTIVITTTIGPSSTATTSGNTTLTSNSTSSSTSTSTKPLPTAPTSVDGGGGPHGAPSPGATGGGYGPDDNYINTAQSLKRNTMLIGMVGLLFGGAVLIL